MKEEKNTVPVCNIMGVNIAAIDMNWLLTYLDRNITSLSGDYICVSNVHTTVMAYENDEYRAIQNGGILAIPDGGPLSSVGRHRGFSMMQRTTGPDLMDEIFRMSAKRRYRHFFYGTTGETLDRLVECLRQKYPGIDIAGTIAPPFRPLTEEEDREVIEQINMADPDFIWVGLGAPKQERWMAEHKGKVKGLMIGVGAGFDFHAGVVKRAPLWMQKYNLEWLYRLFQDPKRLLKRYLVTNTKFIWNAVIKGR